MLVRIVIGLSATVLAFGVAGQRLWTISKLIRSGRPAPERVRGLRRRAEAELVEVGGQKKLLRWTVPGLAHAFTFWGFTILLLTIIEAYGDLFEKTFAHPGLRAQPGSSGSSRTSSPWQCWWPWWSSRSSGSGTRRPAMQRDSRFYGSHTGRGLGRRCCLDRLRRWSRSSSTGRADQHRATSPTPGGPSPPTLVGKALAPLGTGVNSVLETVFVDPERLVDRRVSRVRRRTPSTSTSSWRRSTWPSPASPVRSGALDKTPDMDMENVTEDTVFGAGLVEHFTWKQMLDFVTCTECGRCQSACARRGTPDKPLSPKLVIMGLRDDMFARTAARLLATDGDAPAPATRRDPRPARSIPTCSGRARRAGPASRSVRSTSSTSTRSSTCAATRC